MAESWPQTISLAWTGASGMAYGLRLLEALLDADRRKPCQLPHVLANGGRTFRFDPASDPTAFRIMDRADQFPAHAACSAHDRN